MIWYYNHNKLNISSGQGEIPDRR